MPRRPDGPAYLLACFLASGLAAAATTVSAADEPFNGLGLGMGTLARLSHGEDALDQPGELHRREGQGRHGHRGHRREGRARDLGQGWKVSPSVRIKAKSTFTLAEIAGPGAIQHIWMTPTGHWRYIDPALLLGRRGDAVGRGARWATSSPAAGAGTRRSTRCRSASTPAAPSTATGRCRSASGAAITMENLGDEDDDALLPGQLHARPTCPTDAAYFHAQFRRVNPLPYKERLHDPRRRAGPGPLRRHVPGLGRPQQRLVGRGRDQVLPGRRRGVPHDLRHRHRGLLLRLLQLREPGDEAVPGVHHALRGPRPGASARTASTSRSSASACTAGTSWTRSASRRTCA